MRGQAENPPDFLDTVPVAPIITGTTLHYTFHCSYISFIIIIIMIVVPRSPFLVYNNRISGF